MLQYTAELSIELSRTVPICAPSASVAAPGIDGATASSMTSLRANLRRRWRAFKALPPGERFERFHEQQKDAPAWVKPVMIVSALVSVAVGVVLVLIPGPAFVFFGIAGALLATQSAHVARALDHAEVWGRSLMARARDRWAAMRHRAPPDRKARAAPAPPPRESSASQ